MPHEVRVLSWVQLLLCIRLRAGERGFICTDRNVAPSRNSKESTHRNVRASIKFTGELFKFSGYRDTDFERESSRFYDRPPLRSMRHDQCATINLSFTIVVSNIFEAESGSFVSTGNRLILFVSFHYSDIPFKGDDTADKTRSSGVSNRESEFQSHVYSLAFGSLI